MGYPSYMLFCLDCNLLIRGICMHVDIYCGAGLATHSSGLTEPFHLLCFQIPPALGADFMASFIAFFCSLLPSSLLLNIGFPHPWKCSPAKQSILNLQMSSIHHDRLKRHTHSLHTPSTTRDAKPISQVQGIYSAISLWKAPTSSIPIPSRNNSNHIDHTCDVISLGYLTPWTLLYQTHLPSLERWK